MQARSIDIARLPDDDAPTLVSDVLLPAATWYEKADLSSTDMHPYSMHAFNPAIDSAVGNPFRTSRRSCTMSREISAETRQASTSGTRHDLVAMPRSSMTLPGRRRIRWPVSRLGRMWVRSGTRSDDARIHRWSNATTPLIDDNDVQRSVRMIERLGMSVKGVHRASRCVRSS